MRSQSYYYPGYDNKVMFPYQEFEELKCLLEKAKDNCQHSHTPCGCHERADDPCCKPPIVTTSISQLTTDLQDSIGTSTIVVAGDDVYAYNGVGAKNNLSSYTYIGNRSNTPLEIDPGNLRQQFLTALNF